MTTTLELQRRSLDTEADETREIELGRVDVVELGGVHFGRAIFEPGWSWSRCVKPIAQTESCEFPHAMYITQGSLHVRMDDGTELDINAGDVAIIPPGHDAWVTSEVACVGYDVGDEDADYATPPR